MKKCVKGCVFLLFAGMLLGGCEKKNNESENSNEHSEVAVSESTEERTENFDSGQENDLVFDEKTDPVIHERVVQEIGIKVDARNVTDKGCLIVYSYIKNDKIPAEKLLGGERYYLQEKKENEWKPVQVKTRELFAWQDYGIIINETGEVSEENDWSGIYGTLPAGEYRIIKSISVDSDIKTIRYHDYYVACPFTIQ